MTDSAGGGEPAPAQAENPVPNLCRSAPCFWPLPAGAYFFITYHSLGFDAPTGRASILYDMDGEQIGRFSSEIRTVVSLDDISP